MSKRSLAVFIILSLVFIQCSTRKVEYAFPSDASILPGYDEMMEHLEKGRKLYVAHCGECHGVSQKAKNGIADFSKVQIDNYSANFIRKDPKNHAVAAKLSEDQLGEIILFLTYIKRDKK